MDEDTRKKAIMDAFAIAGQFTQKADSKMNIPYITAEEFWGNTYKQMKSWEEVLRKREIEGAFKR